jgi:uncharacterized protein (DUF3084 family)
MTAGIIFILVILILGGVIANISDRLGKHVGKSRLRLFNLRPKDTAVLVTVVTGTFLSALTLLVLFASSKPLRKGVFQIDDVQRQLNESRKEVVRQATEKDNLQTQLFQVQAELAMTVMRLNELNQLQTKTQQELERVKKELKTVSEERDALLRDIEFLRKQ